MNPSLQIALVFLLLLLPLCAPSSPSPWDESVKSFLRDFAENPSGLLGKRATKSATVLFTREGRSVPVSRLDTESLEVSSGDWAIEVDSKGKMAWFNHLNENRGFAAQGGVLIQTQGGEWSLLQLNVTASLRDNAARQISRPHKAFDVSLMSFNIRYGTASDGSNSWYNRDHLVFKVFNDYHPDFFGLQEALHFQIEEIHANVTGYQWIGVGRDDGKEAGEYSAIFYKADLYEVLEQGTFWYCSTPDVPGCTSYGNNIPRIATWGNFRHRPTGETFHYYNTHYDHESTTSREKSSEQLIEHMSRRQNGGAFFITGDFNCALETSPEITSLKNAGFDDSFRVLFPNATNVGTYNNWVGTTTGTKIDFVFSPRTSEFGAPVEINQALIIHDNENGRYPSDHFPVYASVTVA